MMTADDRWKSKLQQLRAETSADLDTRILAAARDVLTAEHPPRSLKAEDPAMNNAQNGRLRFEQDAAARRHRRPGRALVAFIAALVLLIVGGFLFQSGPVAENYAWGDVAEAVRQRPWIVLQWKKPDGTQVMSWMSFSRKVQAMAEEDGQAFFEDLDQGLRWRYDPQQHVILKSSIDNLDEQQAGMAFFANLFEELFRADEELKLAMPKLLQEHGMKVVGQQRRTVTEEGRDWFEYELRLGDEQREEEQSLIFRVDPETRLPVSVRMKDAPENAPFGEARFTFPDEGPADIYALGVPKDTPIADSKDPHPNVPQEARQLVQEIERSARKLDNFAVLIASVPESGEWHEGRLTKRWKKGNRIRTEIAVFDADQPLAEGLPDPQNPQAWWQARWNEATHVPTAIFNDGTIYQNDAVFQVLNEFAETPTGIFRGKLSDLPQPKWTSRSWNNSSIPPVSQLYPGGIDVSFSRELRGTLQVTVDHDPPEGPEGTILLRIEREWEDAEWGKSHRRWAYRIDPNRSHMVVQSIDDYNQRDGSQSPPTLSTYRVEEAIQRADGLWYPTRVRWEYLVDPEGDDQTENAENHDTKLTYHLIYDFDSPLPDKLFEPEK